MAIEINMLIIIIGLLYPVFVSSSCHDSTSTVCQALQNSHRLPNHDNCNPTIPQSCKMNDIVDSRYATCQLDSHSGHYTGLAYDYRPSRIKKCIPRLYNEESFSKVQRIVSPSFGDFGCVPLPKEKLEEEGAFTCGEHGTRCVCDTGHGKSRDSAQTALESTCRCQWFVDLCQTPNICQSTRAQCISHGVSAVCQCQDKDLKYSICHTSINQCQANPILCDGADSTVCVDLEDRDRTWRLLEETHGDGYVCMRKDLLDDMVKWTQHCRTAYHNSKNTDTAPLNYMDKCCLDHIQCLKSNLLVMTSETERTNIFSYGPCHCLVEFRKCQMNLIGNARFEDMAKAIIEVLPSITACHLDDGKRCDPSQPETCHKGDLIHPSIAHCRIDCNTGPLLPIQLRACYRRQCLPRHNFEGIRLIDTIDQRDSSICRAVKRLPVECGMLHTRCVCDSKPSGTSFTDKCRCQYWPLQP